MFPLGVPAAKFYTGGMDDTLRRPWCHLTPDRLVIGLVFVECLLWLSERYHWFSFNHHRHWGEPLWSDHNGFEEVHSIMTGWAVLLCVASLGLAMLVMLAWFIVALVFRRRFQFGIRSLLLLALAVAIAFGWLTLDMKNMERARRAMVCRDFANIIKSAEQYENGSRLTDSPRVSREKEVVGYLIRACQETDWQDLRHLCTLADAYAGYGEFEKASEFSAKALELAWDEEEKQACRIRLELFKQGKCYDASEKR